MGFELGGNLLISAALVGQQNDPRSFHHALLTLAAASPLPQLRGFLFRKANNRCWLAHCGQFIIVR